MLPEEGLRDRGLKGGLAANIMHAGLRQQPVSGHLNGSMELEYLRELLQVRQLYAR